MPLKKLFAFLLIMALSFTVTADCLQTCQEEYEECLRVSQSSAKERICGQRLRDCNLKCGTDGE
jgi:hypothetical protein